MKYKSVIKKIQKTVVISLMLAVFLAPFFAYAQAPSELDIPEIIPRSEWGADESKMTWPAEYSRVEKFVVHHTASSKLIPDPDGSGEYKNMVRNIYNYHETRKTWYDDNGEYIGYGDIGYNYLIDPNGNIYEGRDGGNGVVAGHVNGYNAGSIGISVLGTYGGNIKNEYVSHPVTAKIKESLGKLIGWLAANNGIDVNKISNFKGKNIDGVVGHRDLSPTTCPGNDLYQQLNSIQADAKKYADEYRKYAYQVGGNKAIYIIEDGYKMKFDSIDKLPTAYKNRIVKPISKSQLDAYKYKNIITYPDGSLLQEFDDSTVYYLENGKKRAMSVSEKEFEKMGFKLKDVKKVFLSDLNIYEDGKIIKYGADQNLIKDKNENVYLLENGQKRKFTSPQLFEYLGYKWENIKEDSDVDFYLNGADMIYPDGTLITGRDNKMYLIENKQRKEISSSNLLKVLGYKKEDLISITEDEINHFPLGKKVAYPEGTLLKAENSPAVYLIENGKRKEFTSAILFEKAGYDWNSIISVREDEIDDYQKNGKVLYPDGLLVKSKDSPDVYLLENGQKRKITSAVLFERLKYNWNDIVSVSSSELSEYPAGKILTYPDGTLIKKEKRPAVYKIEDGRRKEFTSLALFKATKNKWSDVIVLSGEEFSAYDDGGVVRYPEGTLLRQAGSEKVYVIKNGEAKWIRTAAEFKKAGYKWSNVIEVSSAEMSLYINTERSEKTDNGGSNSSDTSNGSSADDNVGNNPNIKIAIYSTSGDDVVVTANGNYSVNYYNPDGAINKTESKSPNEQTVVKYFSSSSYVRFIPSSSKVIMKVLSYNDPSWNKSVDDNEFRGNIEVRYSSASKKVWVINELPIEDYVNGVAEALNDSPDEYLKAFGTVARTYAMYYLKRGGKHSGEPFHLKNSRNGNGNDQVYKGYNFEQRAPKITAANKLTRGYIITYNNKPIVAAYSSDSGGITKSGCEVLSKTYCESDYAYLNGGVEDPINTEHNQGKVSASHGAGMSAVGAYQMALDGNSWQEIIKHYYPGVKVEKYY
jgi:hypothetical protein